jgi:hypothetical protein
MVVTNTAIEEAVDLARTTLKAYKVGLEQELKSDELFFLATAYGRANEQLLNITGWSLTKALEVVANGMDY